MGGRSGGSRRAVVAAAGILVAVPAAAAAQYPYGSYPSGSSGGSQSQPQSQGPKHVNAEGDPVKGGLRFNPANVQVAVGQTVRWTNTDQAVPHTATEDHGLWDLAGTYGNKAVAPTGFGPGQSRQRVFEAGTQHYYCKVHPTQMHGVVRVPVRLAVKPRSGGGRKLVMTWAAVKPAKNRVFDVQVKRAGGDWKDFRTGTTDQSGSRKTHGAKVHFSVRARLRKSSDPKAATGWSPVASINA